LNYQKFKAHFIGRNPYKEQRPELYACMPSE
jgi:hypothetical protein